MEDFGYEKLEVWQRSMELVDQIYREVKSFPKDELFGLVNQMRRSSASIPTNIAEGYGNGSKMFAKHLKISRGPSCELRTQITIARRQAYLNDAQAIELKTFATRVSRMLDGLLKSLGED